MIKGRILKISMEHPLNITTNNNGGHRSKTSNIDSKVQLYTIS